MSRISNDDRKPPQTKLPAWEPTKRKYDHFAATRRMSLVQVVDLAIDALMSLGRDELDALIERQHVIREVPEQSTQLSA